MGFFEKFYLYLSRILVTATAISASVASTTSPMMIPDLPTFSKAHFRFMICKTPLTRVGWRGEAFGRNSAFGLEPIGVVA